jgi:3-oxoacyl-[acyl-carrier protein] reductase
MSRAAETARVAVVTGAAKGIGRSIAARLLAEGYRVAAVDIDAAALRALPERLTPTDPGGLALFEADVADEDAVAALRDAVAARLGPADVLVNNAGWSRPVRHLLEMDADHWDAVVRVNLRTVFLCTQGFTRQMVEHGQPGAVVNISSFSSQRAHRSMAAYDATKGGIDAFTRAAALDLAPFGVRVNAVAPGAIQTEEYDRMGINGIERGQRIPLGRPGSGPEVAAMVAFLASADAGYLTGQVVAVDGGMLAQLRPAQDDEPVPAAVAQLRDLARTRRG